MSFTDTQLKALSAKLNAKHVRTRDKAGLTLSYIEGWHAIAEANRIFGFGSWDRETVATTCVSEDVSKGQMACSYVARVRIRVRAGDVVIVREGSGSGHGAALTLGEAHESALKEAETDATKRALMTFGNPFGLALYDKEHRKVTGASPKPREGPETRKVEWVVLSAKGQPLSRHHDPVEFCAAVRRVLEKIKTAKEAMAFWKQNQETVGLLRRTVPHLTTEKGQHYAEIVSALYGARLQAFAREKVVVRPLPKGAEAKVDKSKLVIGERRRVRNKEHLSYVASQPCLVCGRVPSQAHHIRFAQPRALGRKVSDEWVVPLCVTHHRALHACGDEERCWNEHSVDPIAEAERLWRHTQSTKSGFPNPLEQEEV